METVVDEISQAIHRLGLDPTQVRLLPSPEGEEVFRATLSHFVASGDRQWWWEDFRTPGTSFTFDGGDGWKRLPQIVPDPKESVWFITEDDSLPYYPVFETTPEIASLVIGECYGFEYYLVAKDLTWLLCETHHNVVFAVGNAVETRLQHAAF